MRAGRTCGDLGVGSTRGTFARTACVNDNPQVMAALAQRVIEATSQ